MRYEDLVADPEALVQEVCDHLGLGYNSEMLAIERSDRTKIVDDQAAWFAGVVEPITAAGSDRWQTEMSEADQRVIAAVAGPELRELGYEVMDGAEACRAPGRSATRRRTPRSGPSTSSACGIVAGARAGAALRAQAQARERAGVSGGPVQRRVQARARPGRSPRSGSSS